MFDLIIAIVVAVILIRVIETASSVLWQRYSYRGHGYFGPRKLLGRYEEGSVLPLWVIFLRRFFEGF